MKLFIAATFLSLTGAIANAADAQKEAFYNEAWCAEQGGETEVVTNSGTRVDCVTSAYAVEADFDHKWAEGLGQALHYSVETGKPGAILLIIRDIEGDRDRFVQRLQTTIDGFGLPITVFTIKVSDYPLRDN